jgi:pentatricopeptide repeat protein
MPCATGCAPTERTFGALLNVHAKAGDVEAATRIFKSMEVRFVFCFDLPRWAVMRCDALPPTCPPSLHRPAQAAGIAPNVRTYTCLMDACTNLATPASLRLVSSLLRDMRAEGLAPTGITYGCMLVACEKQGDVDSAFQLYRQACEEVRSYLAR